MKLVLPQNLEQLSSTTQKNRPIENWSGAVVVTIIEEMFVLIRRSDTMPTHKGQIGFMGGHKSLTEIDPIDTAMREFEEESGIDRSQLDIQGLLKPVVTSRQRLIIPVVAKSALSKEIFFSKVQSNGEWDNIVMAPIKYLAQSHLWSYGHYCLDQIDKSYPVYFASLSQDECFYMNPYRAPCQLWGASAKMILNFLNFWKA